MILLQSSCVTLNCIKIQRLPFDWRNPFGFLVAIAIQYVMLSYTLIVAAVMMTLAIGAYLFGMAASKCIKGSLFNISRNIKARRSRKHVMKQVIEFVEFHSTVKQLSETVFS